jgi:molybdate-binding protein/DNA-binding XRE family transcriptional regulator
MGVKNNLAALRRKRGLAAPEVALAVGVNRQTIYAIEGGSYVPNTLVALRLARLFEVNVEEIFLLEAAAPPPDDLQQVTLLPGDESGSGGLLQLCQVDDRLIAVRPSLTPWVLPAADAVLCEEENSALESDQRQVRSFRDFSEYGKRLLIAGCDPAISIVARHMQKEGVDAVVVGRNSTQSIELLKQGLVHVAGTHMPEASGESHFAGINKHFAGGSIAVFSYAIWEQGLVLAKGNPKEIRGIDDLARKEIRIVNREPGAGSRVLLDTNLSRLAIPPHAVLGYSSLASGHLSAARRVQKGEADCCVATRAAANLYGLEFLPLVRERYDFVIQTKHLDLPGIQVLLETLGRAALRRELQEFGGYETSVAGARQE